MMTRYQPQKGWMQTLPGRDEGSWWCSEEQAGHAKDGMIQCFWATYKSGNIENKLKKQESGLMYVVIYVWYSYITYLTDIITYIKCILKFSKSTYQTSSYGPCWEREWDWEIRMGLPGGTLALSVLFTSFAMWTYLCVTSRIINK